MSWLSKLWNGWDMTKPHQEPREPTREELQPHIGEPVWTILDLLVEQPERFNILAEEPDKLTLLDTKTGLFITFTTSVGEMVDFRGKMKRTLDVTTNLVWLNYDETRALYKQAKAVLQDDWVKENNLARDKVMSLYNV